MNETKSILLISFHVFLVADMKWFNVVQSCTPRTITYINCQRYMTTVLSQ